MCIYYLSLAYLKYTIHCMRGIFGKYVINLVNWVVMHIDIDRFGEQDDIECTLLIIHVIMSSVGVH